MKIFWYGSQSTPAQRYMTNGLVIGAAAGVYGCLVDFVPSAFWWTWGLVLSVGATAVCLVAIFRGYETGQLRSDRVGRAAPPFLSLFVLAVLVFCIWWLVIVRALPDTLARMSGAEAELTVPLEAI